MSGASKKKLANKKEPHLHKTVEGGSGGHYVMSAKTMIDLDVVAKWSFMSRSSKTFLGW